MNKCTNLARNEALCVLGGHNWSLVSWSEVTELKLHIRFRESRQGTMKKIRETTPYYPYRRKTKIDAKRENSSTRK